MLQWYHHRTTSQLDCCKGLFHWKVRWRHGSLGEEVHCFDTRFASGHVLRRSMFFVLKLGSSGGNKVGADCFMTSAHPPFHSTHQPLCIRAFFMSTTAAPVTKRYNYGPLCLPGEHNDDQPNVFLGMVKVQWAAPVQIRPRSTLGSYE